MGWSPPAARSPLLNCCSIAQIGLEAGQPIFASIAKLSGFVAVFENFIQIGILFFAWLVVLLSLFILAIQGAGSAQHACQYQYNLWIVIDCPVMIVVLQRLKDRL